MLSSNTITSFTKRLRSGARIDPVRDWLILAGIGMGALVIIIVWNLWTFGTIAGGVGGSQATSTPSAFGRSSLDTIQSVFANRAAEQDKYETGVYSFVDPSL